MKLSDYSHVTLPPNSGDLYTEIESMYLLNGKDKIWVHVRQVADIALQIAEQYDLDRTVCELGGLLHDISAVINPSEMMEWAIDEKWTLDPAEEKYPFLLHQKVSAEIAGDVYAIEDQRILSAIACHTTLKAKAGQYDMAVFIADKIAWDLPGTPPWIDTVKAGLVDSLEKSCLNYLTYSLANNLILFPHSSLLEAQVWLEDRVGH